VLALAIAASPAGAALRVANSFAVGSPEAIAVDESSGDVYVVSTQEPVSLKRFDSAGAPEPFTAVGSYVAGNELTGTTAGPFVFDTSGSAIEVAVDNSGGLNDGNIYVTESGGGAVDVFASSGEYLGNITEAAGGPFNEPCGVAVDSSGKVYVGDFGGSVDRYVPTADPPTNSDYDAQILGVESPCSVAADSTGAVYASTWSSGPLMKYNASDFGTANPGASVDVSSNAVAVDLSTNDVYVDEGESVARFGSAGSLIATFGMGEVVPISRALAVHGAAGNVYVADPSNGKVQLFAPQPAMQPITIFGQHTAILPGTAVSDGFDVSYHFEYSADGVSWTKAPVPNGVATGAPGSVPLSQEVKGLVGSQLYHVRLFAGRPEAGGGGLTSEEVTFTTLASPPEISGTGASVVTATEATLRAFVNPDNEATSYHFEYVSDANFQASAYAHATRTPALDVSIGSGGTMVPVSRLVTGLTPGTKYHIRVVATNPTGVTPGEEGKDRVFTTYPAPREGLPDDRAYELVSPADSNGQIPVGKVLNSSSLPNAGVFNYSLISSDESSPLSAMFYVSSGSLPGLGGAGTSDRYEAVRGENGWTTRYIGQSGAQAEYPSPGSASPDLGYSFLQVQSPSERGSFKAGCERCTFLRHPDGSYTRVGEGDLATNLEANGKWITSGGTHVIFSSLGKLESNAPVASVEAIYDRTPEGLHVISLLPGNVTPPNTTSTYLGSSADGSAVAFRNGTTLYLRRNNAETLTIATGNTTFAGLSRNGSRIFFLKGATTSNQITRGELFVCNTDEGSCAGAGPTHPAVQIGAAGAPVVVVVNVSSDGSHVYFVSPSVLTGAEENANAEKAVLNAQNFYVRSGSGIRFIGSLKEADVVGTGTTGPHVNGLGLWTESVLSTGNLAQGVGNDPSRTTPDGSVLVFQSRANLTAYDSGGHSEVYRYTAGDLSCVSCSPSNAAASSDAGLEDPTGLEQESPVLSRVEIANVTTNGKTVFFETGDALVAGDGNGNGDVYEWEAEGVGGCTAAGGCLGLISSGQSSRRSYLYGMTADGHDVFFWTAGALVAQDHNQGTPTIYDARVGGGFPPPSEEQPPCQGDACQGQASGPPSLAAPGSSAGAGSGNVKQHRHGKKKHKKHKKKHHHNAKHQHSRTGIHRRTGR
jgi:hypothetical protein